MCHMLPGRAGPGGRTRSCSKTRCDGTRSKGYHDFCSRAHPALSTRTARAQTSTLGRTQATGARPAFVRRRNLAEAHREHAWRGAVSRPRLLSQLGNTDGAIATPTKASRVGERAALSECHESSAGDCLIPADADNLGNRRKSDERPGFCVTARVPGRRPCSPPRGAREARTNASRN